jgi:hypothetical protein
MRKIDLRVQLVFSAPRLYDVKYFLPLLPEVFVSRPRSGPFFSAETTLED